MSLSQKYFSSTMELNERQLEFLIHFYGRTLYSNHIRALCLDRLELDSDWDILLDNGFIKMVFDMIGGEALSKGFVLTRKAKEIVKRRAGLRLVCELLSRVNSTLPSDDLRDIVATIPFKKLPQLLSCDDEYIRELAVARLKERQHCA